MEVFFDVGEEERPALAGGNSLFFVLGVEAFEDRGGDLGESPEEFTEVLEDRFDGGRCVFKHRVVPNGGEEEELLVGLDGFDQGFEGFKEEGDRPGLGGIAVEDIAPDGLDVGGLAKEAVVLFAELVAKGDLGEEAIVLLDRPEGFGVDVGMKFEELDQGLVDLGVAFGVKDSKREARPEFGGEAEGGGFDGGFDADAEEAEASVGAVGMAVDLEEVAAQDPGHRAAKLVPREEGADRDHALDFLEGGIQGFIVFGRGARARRGGRGCGGEGGGEGRGEGGEFKPLLEDDPAGFVEVKDASFFGEEEIFVGGEGFHDRDDPGGGEELEEEGDEGGSVDLFGHQGGEEGGLPRGRGVLKPEELTVAGEEEAFFGRKPGSELFLEEEVKNNAETIPREEFEVIEAASVEGKDLVGWVDLHEGIPTADDLDAPRRPVEDREEVPEHFGGGLEDAEVGGKEVGDLDPLGPFGGKDAADPCTDGSGLEGKPGERGLKWIRHTATLIYHERDALLARGSDRWKRKRREGRSPRGRKKPKRRRFVTRLRLKKKPCIVGRVCVEVSSLRWFRWLRKNRT